MRPSPNVALTATFRFVARLNPQITGSGKITTQIMRRKKVSWLRGLDIF